MMIRFFRLIGAGFFFSLFLSDVRAQADGLLPCGTYKATELNLGDDAEYFENRRKLEDYTTAFQENAASREAAKIIPVVVHIIHNYGQENITDEQVHDAIRIVNEDFRKLNPDINQVVPAFTAIAADAGFEFRLARKDPQGKCTNGITRTASRLTFSADDNVKSLVSWPTNRYLNIWVVQSISFGAGGYAYLPGTSVSSGVDGIVVVNRQFGSIGTSAAINFAARTLTHEIGHWLNLSHVWGDNDIGQTSNCSNVGDNVQDTPKTIGTINVSCNLNQNTCTNEIPDKIDNVQNYMDYSGCALMFTVGQKNRMVAASNSSISGRNNVWSAPNLDFTGVNAPPTVCAPKVDFRVNFNQVCPDVPISLSDKSYNADIDDTWQWSWQMPGGTPSSANQRNTSVRYSSPGIYPVTLTVTNSAGSGTLTRSEFIYVNTDEPALTAPVSEGFENSSFPNATPDFNKNWRFEGPSNAFARTSSAFSSGGFSIRYQNLGQSTGTVASLISPPISFTEAQSPASITFKVAYARRNNESIDKLEVFISTDCGKSWSRRYLKAGSNLSTVSNNISAAFTPNSGQWRTETINVSNLIGAPKGMVKFTITDGSGNNIYLDDIHILNTPLGLNNPDNTGYLNVFPNPGDGDAILEWEKISGSDLKVSVLDMTGRLMGEIQVRNNPQGVNNLLLSGITGATLASGTYLIRVQTETSQKVFKWVAR
jgi:PKD repeat protein